MTFCKINFRPCRNPPKDILVSALEVILNVVFHFVHSKPINNISTASANMDLTKTFAFCF